MNAGDEDALVRYISLVRREGGEPMLGIPYREMSVDPDLVASFVLAIIIFENRQLRTFTKEGYVVIIEEGNHTVGLLIVDKVEDDESYRSNLREIIHAFEEEFSPILSNWKGDIRPFREFALNVLGYYPYREIDFQMVPILISNSDAYPDQRAQIPWSVGETDVKIQTTLGFVNGRRSVKEIMESTKLSESETQAIFSMLHRYKWVRFRRKLSSDSRLVKISDPPKYLIGAYGAEFEKLIELFDGTRTFSEVCASISIDVEVVTTLAKNLIEVGVLGYNEDE